MALMEESSRGKAVVQPDGMGEPRRGKENKCSKQSSIRNTEFIKAFIYF